MKTPIDLRVAQEGVLLGSLLGELEGGEERVMPEILALGPGCFQDPVFRRIWSAMLSCYAEGGDAHPERLCRRLERDAEARAWIDSVSQVLDSSPWGISPTTTRLFARELVERNAHGELRRAQLRAIDHANAGEHEEAKALLREALAAHDRQMLPSVAPGHVAALVRAETERMLSDEPRDPRSVLWGLRALDDAGSYLRPADFAVVAARPGGGKTTFAIQTAVSMLRRSSGPIVFASLEMTPERVARKTVLHRAGSRDPECCRVTEEERAAIAEAAAWVADQPLFIPPHAPGDVTSFCAWLRGHIKSQEPQVVIVDYLGLVTGIGSNAYERMGDVSRKVRAIALDTNVVILALHQMNRAANHERRPPQLHDLRDSGQLEQDVTHALFIHHERDEETRRRRTFLYTRKSRWGACPGVELVADFERSRMMPKARELVTMPSTGEPA